MRPTAPDRNAFRVVAHDTLPWLISFSLDPRNSRFISAYLMQPFSMIIEMRTYKIEVGKRAEFLKILETKAIPAHQKIGMKILGPFLSVEDDNTFFWMRAFPDQQSRQRMRNEFYEGKLWKEELEQKLMPILEKYDVVVVEAKEGLGEWR